MITKWEVAELFALLAGDDKTEIKAFEDSRVFRIVRRLGWNPLAFTFGRTIFMERRDIGTDRGAKILRHETVHVAQYQKFRFLFWFSYLLLLPIGPSLKAYWEWQAYKKNLEMAVEDSRDMIYDSDRQKYLDRQKDYVARQFWSPLYLWMWPFPKMVRRMIDKEVDRLLKQELR